VQEGLSEAPRFGPKQGGSGTHGQRRTPRFRPLGGRGTPRSSSHVSPDPTRTLFQSPSTLSAEDARPSGVHASPPSVSDCLQALSNTPLQPFSGRASPGHKREVAKAVVNALGGADQLGYLLQMVLSSDQFCENVEERTSLAVSVVEASRALVNKDPEAPYRVLPTPPLPKVVSFAMECGLSRGTLMLARKHFPDLFPHVGKLAAYERSIETELVAIKEGDDRIAYAVKDIRKRPSPRAKPLLGALRPLGR